MKLRLFKLFLSSKIDFWPFLKFQKMDFGKKKFHENDLFDFTSFFGLDDYHSQKPKSKFFEKKSSGAAPKEPA